MRGRTILLALLPLAAMLSTDCGVRENPPGRPRPDSEVLPPNKVADFDLLYSSNCSGCHGAEGKGGPALGLNNPVYLTIADDATIRQVTANGVPGTAMPAFAKESGGMLTEDQVSLLVTGIRSRWAKPDALQGAIPPPYQANVAGDVDRGAKAFITYCASCHGVDGKGGQASSIVDDSFLGLVSDQSLRTTVIVGRPEIGAPDWREDVPGKPMTPEAVSDVVAWLSAQRSQYPGRPYSNTSQLIRGAQ